MSGKRKEKILYLGLKGTPIGSLVIAATKKGLVNVSMGRRSDRKLLADIANRLQCSPDFLKIKSFYRSNKKSLFKNFSKSARSLLLRSDRNLISKPEEIKNQLKVISEAAYQLDRYFSGYLKKFHVRKDFTGLTDFEKKVLKELERIPCGRRVSYQDIARRIGKPRACRAVGNAVGKNPFSVIVPCHRVIKSDGTIGGFSAPLSIKKKLLLHEHKINSKRQQPFLDSI